MTARVVRLLRRLATIAVMSAVKSVEAQGQFAPGVDVRQGMPLRVYVRDGPPRESAFAYVSPSALHLREHCDSCTAVLAIPWSDVTRVDGIVVGPPSAGRILVGGLVGASATVVTLAMVITAVGTRCDWNQRRDRGPIHHRGRNGPRHDRRLAEARADVGADQID